MCMMELACKLHRVLACRPSDDAGVPDRLRCAVVSAGMQRNVRRRQYRFAHAAITRVSHQPYDLEMIAGPLVAGALKRLSHRIVAVEVGLRERLIHERRSRRSLVWKS